MNDTVRADFEAWRTTVYKSLRVDPAYFLQKDVNGQYKISPEQQCWEGYQAGRVDAGMAELKMPSDPPDQFTAWVAANMPSATIISNPMWWAPRLWKASMHSLLVMLNAQRETRGRVK